MRVDQYGVEEGRRYAVDIQDCCVRAQFTAVLTKIRRSPGDDDWVDALEFDNGVVISEGNGVDFEEVEN